MTNPTIKTFEATIATWSAAEAKAKFSELVEGALHQGPQMITRNGKPAAVVVSAEEWARRIAPHKSFAEMMGESPLVGLDPPLERPDDRLHDPQI